LFLPLVKDYRDWDVVSHQSRHEGPKRARAFPPACTIKRGSTKMSRTFPLRDADETRRSKAHQRKK